MTQGNSVRAPYQQVVWDIRTKIESGALKPGEKIPSQRAIADQYGIAPMTAAKAVRALCDDGWTVSTPSLGVFVSDTMPTESNSSDTLTDEVRELRSIVDDLTRRMEQVERGRSVDQVDR